jgi:pilus assembly protein Flp/PilA
MEVASSFLPVTHEKGGKIMRESLLRLRVRMQILLNDNGQDLIEYALVVALIAFAATVGMSTVASDINAAFINIGTKVSNYTT